MTKEKVIASILFYFDPAVEDAVDAILFLAREQPPARSDVAKVIRDMAEDVADAVYNGARDEMMTTAQVSQLVGLSRQRLSELSRKHNLGVMLGRARWYTPDEVALLANRPKWQTRRDKGIDM